MTPLPQRQGMLAAVAFQEEGNERNQDAADHASPPKAEEALLGFLVSFPLIKMSFPCGEIDPF